MNSNVLELLELFKDGTLSPAGGVAIKLSYDSYIRIARLGPGLTGRWRVDHPDFKAAVELYDKLKDSPVWRLLDEEA